MVGMVGPQGDVLDVMCGATHIKMGKMVNLLLCVFCHNEK